MRLSDLPIINPATANQPKYRQIAAVLEEFLQRANLAEGERFFSDRALAQRFSTTPVTVAHSLNYLVSKGLLCRRAGSGTYVGKRMAVRRSNRRIGIICHQMIMADSCYNEVVLSKFSEFFEKLNYECISFKGAPSEWRRLIKEYDLCGIMVFVPEKGFGAELSRLRAENIPVVSIGYAMPELPDVSFGTDHAEAVKSAVDYLCSMGHSKIAIFYNPTQASGPVFAASYRQAMWNHQLPVHPLWEVDTSLLQQCKENPARYVDIWSVIQQQKAANIMPTAVLTPNICDAAAIYNIASQHDLNIPEDISLIAFDDPVFAAELNPPLTVVAQDLEYIASSAAAALLAMIEKRNDSKKLEYKTPNLIRRNSVRRIITEPLQEENHVEA
jgi:LacI family transcriptional regulator